MGNSAPYLIAILIAIPLAQLLVWLLARHSTFVEFWRVIPVTVAGVMCGSLVLHALAELGPVQIAGFTLAGAFAAWIITGLFYDLEIGHRIAVSLSIPIIGTGALYSANALCGELARQIVGA